MSSRRSCRVDDSPPRSEYDRLGEMKVGCQLSADEEDEADG